MRLCADEYPVSAYGIQSFISTPKLLNRFPFSCLQDEMQFNRTVDVFSEESFFPKLKANAGNYLRAFVASSCDFNSTEEFDKDFAVLIWLDLRL